MSKGSVYQLLLLLLLPASCLSVCSSNVTLKLTSWNGKCKEGKNNYDLCNNGRGFCFRWIDNPEKRLKCYDGLPCDCFPDVANGYFVLKDPLDNTLGATAELTCYPGYRVRRTTTITCKLNSTWSLPSRKCKLVGCGAAPSVSHGSYVTPFGTKYPAVGHMVCAEGYVLTYSSLGDAFLRCDEHGDWIHGSATCEPVDCGTPPTLEYGVFNASSGTNYRSEAHLHCDENYFPDDDSLTSIVCDANGCWTTPYADCVTPACAAFPVIANGDFLLTDPLDSVFGATSELTCSPGYHAIGPTTIDCTASGDWSSPSGTCETEDCGASPTVQHGAYDTPFGTTYQAVGHMWCDAGFVLTYSSPGDDFIRCDEHGVWGLGSSTCEPVDCGDPPTLAHGVFNASSGTIYQSEAELDCDDNYFPDNDSLTNIVCGPGGGWSTQYATCVTPACGALPVIVNGNFLLTDRLDWEYGAAAELACSPGYFSSGPTTIDCTVNGNWSLPSGSCEPKDCGVPPMVQNGVFEILSGTTYQDTGFLLCAEGFVLSYSPIDDPLLTCDVNGTWDVGSAICEPIDCGDPPSIQHGVFNASSGTAYLSEAFLVCLNESRHLDENLTSIVCQGSGEWSEPLTICVTKGCYCDTGSWHYSNKWRWTSSGVECQRWDKQTPHAHSYWSYSSFPPGETYVMADNYCRDPTKGALVTC